MIEYVFKMYADGKVILETNPMTLEKARDYYMANYNTSCALRLFVDGEKVPYGKIARVLKLTTVQCLNTFDVSLAPITINKGV